MAQITVTAEEQNGELTVYTGSVNVRPRAPAHQHPRRVDVLTDDRTSGHGFKLGRAFGEEVTRLIATGEAPMLEPLGVERLLR